MGHAATMPRTASTALRVLTVAVGGGAAACSLGRALRHLGASADERALAMPGDERLPDADIVSTRAVTICAPAEAVWPWLVQLGWGRAGWYSLDLVEAAIGAARSVDADGRRSWRSLRQIVPAHQHLAVGDRIPLHTRAGFDVVALEPGSYLVAEVAVGAGPASSTFSWTLMLVPYGEGDSCRLVARSRMRAGGPVRRLLLHALLDPGHAVMELAQLRGIRERATALVAATDDAPRACRVDRDRARRRRTQLLPCTARWGRAVR
jgi:hypothetical protein